MQIHQFKMMGILQLGVRSRWELKILARAGVKNIYGLESELEHIFMLNKRHSGSRSHVSLRLSENISVVTQENPSLFGVAKAEIWEIWVVKVKKKCSLRKLGYRLELVLQSFVFLTISSL